MADEPAAGTPGATSEGAVTDSGTPVASQDGSGAATVDADEIKKLRDIRDQFLREKDNTERIRQENEMLRQQVEQASRVIAPPTGYDPAAQRLQRAAQLLQNIDPDTAQAITEIVGISHEETRATLQRTENQRRFERELDAISDPVERAEARKVSETEQIWPSLAIDRVRARRYDKERTELAEQRRKLQEQEDRLKRGVVKTTAEPSPPAPQGNSPTQEEYARTVRQAAEGSQAARKQVAEWDRREEADGPIKFRSG